MLDARPSEPSSGFGTVLPKPFWILTTVLETSIPAWAIAFLPSQQIEAAYRPLASPALLVFFIFIIMSTLRLDPRLSLFSGLVASATYLCAALYLGWRPPLPGSPALISQSAVSLNAVTLVVGGVVAGVVTGQIREHIHAALQEAETKRRLEAVQRDLQIARSIQQSPGAAWFFTTNHEFFWANQYSPGMNVQSQKPIGAFEGHFSYDVKPRMWASLDGNFWFGGRTTLNDVENPKTLQKNSRIGGTVSLPLSKHQSLKFSYSRGAFVRYGGNYDNVSVAWQYSWLGRPN